MDITFTCSKCGQHIAIDEAGAGQFVNCPKCQVPLRVPEKSAPASVTPPATPAPTPAPSNLVKCPDCGREVSKRAASCPHCGAPIQTAQLAIRGEQNERFHRNGRRNLLVNIPAILSVVSVLCVLGAIWFYFSPHRAVASLREAAEKMDEPNISKYVDYPAFRESVKANVTTTVTSAVANSSKTDGFAALGAALGAVMINHLVDGLITPEGVAMMIKTGKMRPPDERERADHPERTTVKANIAVSMEYDGLNRFVVRVMDKTGQSTASKGTELIFTRHGIFSWKLSGLRLPPPDPGMV